MFGRQCWWRRPILIPNVVRAKRISLTLNRAKNACVTYLTPEQDNAIKHRACDRIAPSFPAKQVRKTKYKVGYRKQNAPLQFTTADSHISGYYKDLSCMESKELDKAYTKYDTARHNTT